MASAVSSLSVGVRPVRPASTAKPAAPAAAAMSGLRTATSSAAPAFLPTRPAQLSAGLASAGSGSGARSRGVATMGLFGLGLPELVVIGGVAALLFGPAKLPELGKTLGKTVKSFQSAATVRAAAAHRCPRR